MDTKYFFYEKSNAVETLLETIPNTIIPIELGSQESYDILCEINQGLPTMPFLATKTETSWEITYFTEPYSWE